METANLPVPTPQFCERNSSGNALLVTSIITFVAATVLVFLRIYVRIQLSKCFWWDDITLAIAYLISVAGCALQWKQLELGLGRHIECSSLEDSILRGELEWIATTVLGLSVIFTRSSVALFVIRLFAVTPLVRKLLYGFMAFMIVSLLTTLILLWKVCTPIAAIWNPALLESAQCWSPLAESFIDNYNGAVSILSDLLLALLPAYFLGRLKMRMHVKIGIASLMAIGILTAACALARTILTPAEDETDPAYSGAILLVFGTLEMEVGLIAAAIPGLPPLFKKDKRANLSRTFYYKDLLLCGFRPFKATTWRSTRKGTRNDEYGMNPKSTSLTERSLTSESVTPPVARNSEGDTTSPAPLISVTHRWDVEYHDSS